MCAWHDVGRTNTRRSRQRQTDYVWVDAGQRPIDGQAEAGQIPGRSQAKAKHMPGRCKADAVLNKCQAYVFDMHEHDSMSNRMT